MIGNLDWTSFDSTEVGTMYYADNNLWNALVSILLGFAFFLLVASVTIGTNLLYDWHTSKESGPMKTKPFCQDYHNYLKEYENLKNVPEARMYFLEDKCQMSNLSTKKLSSLMAIIFKNDNPEVPKHARVISIKMAGFKYGNECHDFEPINGRAPGSEYCYKTFGNNRIQGTFYKENDVYYLAGFCIYVKNEFVMGFNFREDDVRWLMGGTPYPARTRGIRNTKSEMELAKRIMELKIEENSKNEEKGTLWVYLPSQPCRGSQECSRSTNKNESLFAIV
ncbi:Protein CBG13610 [Caenorhabditis briggsae]|uniref:Protein CBG13610 n=1 Tax=Caenorhabditis briggsae TaxID=6238 RepID=A8XIB0_CAEBR|nr:Protein CBG13610 [Caenorhabditis briggsae]CAP32384.1 Protein CBG13610 [Caenorhabditis briggsae]